MVTQPLQDIEAWVVLFSDNRLPVLRLTQRQIDKLREDLDKVSARDLAHFILQDPIMSVRTLAYIQPMRGRHLQHDITTIASAIMMSGIEPFFNRFVELPTVEAMLKDESPHAKLGVMQVIRRAQRAAEYANEWAFWRHDVNAEEVRLAALLHDLSEILIWCFAPKLALQIRELRIQHPTMRSAAAQEKILGFTLLELQQALCRVWHLPELLKNLMDDDHAEMPRARNVTLAVRLARHSANGWDDPALPDDYKDIGELLHLTPDNVMQKVGAVPQEDAETPTAEATPEAGGNA